ncbi:MAG: hypothetical protein K2I06_05665 [Ruminococcus sp.]|nr:hypothetical protein [Ruminococcus sp.]
MAETRFLKTVTFGGYDKEDVEKHLSALYSRISELESELKETKLFLEKYKTGTETEKIYESALEEERKRLAECQAEKRSADEKIQMLTADNEEKEKEITNLKYSVAELEQTLSDADIKLSSMSEKDDAAVFGAVFATAKKSASTIIDEAKKKAAEIIYEAETYAAEMTAEVNNESKQLKHASVNMKALILEDVIRLSEKMSEMKDIFEKSEKILSDTRNTIEKDGVPVFCIPEKFTPDLPEKPVYEKTDYSYNKETAEKVHDEYDEYANVPDFDELEEVDIFGDDDDDFDLSGLARPTQNTASNKGGINLDALTRQAEEFVAMSKKPKKESIGLDELAKQAAALDDVTQKKNNKSIDLEELARQATALDDVPAKKKNSGSIDLEELARQAAALDDN